MTRIFISNSRSEGPVAVRLAERLGEAGYGVWCAAGLVGGQRFEEEIHAALAQRDKVAAPLLPSVRFTGPSGTTG